MAYICLGSYRLLKCRNIHPVELETLQQEEKKKIAREYSSCNMKLLIANFKFQTIERLAITQHQ